MPNSDVGDGLEGDMPGASEGPGTFGGGVGRERRRRDRDEDRDGEEEDVITTIFVVGFPDDIMVS
jgi:hypothetical protein